MAGILAWAGVVVVIVDVEICKLESKWEWDGVAVGGVGCVLWPMRGKHEFGSCDIGGSPICS